MNHFDNTMLNSFKLRRLLGKGAFGKVFKVDKVDQKHQVQTYAMKVVKKSRLIRSAKNEKAKQKMIENAHLEKDILLSIEHPFVIKLYASFQTETKIYLLLEYASRSDLEDLLKIEVILTNRATLFYISQVVLVVEYLHSRGIMHRDIKPANILIDYKGYVKLADFGVSRNNFTFGRAYSRCGTPQFMAPEMFTMVGYGMEVDWWAVGCLLCLMLTGVLPDFVGGKTKNSGIAKFYGPMKPAARNLLISLLQENVNMRLGTKRTTRIKEHAYFKDTNWENILKRSEDPPFLPQLKRGSPISRLLKKLFPRRLQDSAASAIDEKYNIKFKGFTFIGDIVNTN